MNPKLTKKMKYIPVERALYPTAEFLHLYRDYWWAVTPGGDIMLYSKSPQCNSNPEIVKNLIKKLYPECRAVQYSRIYIPIEPRDYV